MAPRGKTQSSSPETLNPTRLECGKMIEKNKSCNTFEPVGREIVLYQGDEVSVMVHILTSSVTFQLTWKPNLEQVVL